MGRINMKYGDLPVNLGQYDIKCDEMMFTQYMPIKLSKNEAEMEQDMSYSADPRFDCFRPIIVAAEDDFLEQFGYDAYEASYIYLTAKHLYQAPNTSFNRFGYHSDGFMTPDINYVWCNSSPTIFNNSEFNITQEDVISMVEMNQQANENNEVTYGNNTLLRLNEFNIHKVGEHCKGGMRTFVKISFSQEKYNLVGNAKNYLLDYDWEMVERKNERNIPHTKIN